MGSSYDSSKTPCHVPKHRLEEKYSGWVILLVVLLKEIDKWPADEMPCSIVFMVDDIVEVDDILEGNPKPGVLDASQIGQLGEGNRDQNLLPFDDGALPNSLNAIDIGIGSALAHLVGRFSVMPEWRSNSTRRLLCKAIKSEQVIRLLGG